jgi:hypothetical protein
MRSGGKWGRGEGRDARAFDRIVSKDAGVCAASVNTLVTSADTELIEEASSLASAQKSSVHLERRILRCGTYELDPAVLYVGQKQILLGFVEPDHQLKVPVPRCSN